MFILQQNMRDARPNLRFVIERLNEAFSDLNGADIHIGLYGDVDLRCRGRPLS
jgi:hypothetical protein